MSTSDGEEGAGYNRRKLETSLQLQHDAEDILERGENNILGFSMLLRSYFSFPMGWSADRDLLTTAEQRAFVEIAPSTSDSASRRQRKQRLRACIWDGANSRTSWLWLACGPAKPKALGVNQLKAKDLVIIAGIALLQKAGDDNAGAQGLSNTLIQALQVATAAGEPAWGAIYSDFQSMVDVRPHNAWGYFRMGYATLGRDKNLMATINLSLNWAGAWVVGGPPQASPGRNVTTEEERQQQPHLQQADPSSESESDVGDNKVPGFLDGWPQLSSSPPKEPSRLQGGRDPADYPMLHQPGPSQAASLPLPCSGTTIQAAATHAQHPTSSTPPKTESLGPPSPIKAPTGNGQGQADDLKGTIEASTQMPQEPEGDTGGGRLFGTPDRSQRGTWGVHPMQRRGPMVGSGSSPGAFGTVIAELQERLSQGHTSGTEAMRERDPRAESRGSPGGLRSPPPAVMGARARSATRNMQQALRACAGRASSPRPKAAMGPAPSSETSQA
ncbi:hypothetical protein WJX84_007620 [Apatococcus fuscideae]|uniref:Uncharacterized protein n=1 Tax=Apatococcus fuscideae TaxID=2026836 RepID=A0AAW1RUD9_9CHLO